MTTCWSTSAGRPRSISALVRVAAVHASGTATVTRCPVGRVTNHASVATTSPPTSVPSGITRTRGAASTPGRSWTVRNTTRSGVDTPRRATAAVRIHTWVASSACRPDRDQVRAPCASATGPSSIRPTLFSRGYEDLTAGPAVGNPCAGPVPDRPTPSPPEGPHVKDRDAVAAPPHEPPASQRVARRGYVARGRPGRARTSRTREVPLYQGPGQREDPPCRSPVHRPS